MAKATFKIGAAARTITPFMDMPMAGYYYDRYPVDIHDDLLARCLVIEARKQVLVLVECDIINMDASIVEPARLEIQRRCRIHPDRLIIGATHCHSGPKPSDEYRELLIPRIADAVQMALARRVPAKLFRGKTEETTLPKYRRWRMKNGTVKTNPGKLNPARVQPVGSIDPDLFVLYAESLSGIPIATWINFALHVDTVGSEVITADFPYFLSEFLQKIKGDRMLVLFAPGCCANINHVDTASTDRQYSFAEARRIGYTLGAAVMRTYENMTEITDPTLWTARKSIEITPHKPSAKEIQNAEKILRTPRQSKPRFPFEQPDTVRKFTDAEKIVALHARKVKKLPLEVMACRIADVTLTSLPGEIFSELGQQVKKASPFAMTMVQELSNSSRIGDGIGNYVPTRKAFREGGYETARSWMAPGGGERIVTAAVELLRELAENNEYQ